MIVLGVDPGLSITGAGLIQIENRHIRFLHAEAIRSDSKSPLEDRLLKISEGLQSLIDHYHPEVMAVEEVFYSRNVKTAITMGHTRGAVILTGATNNMVIASFSPREVKMSLAGNGAAGKEQVQFMVQRILKLKEKPHPLDISDALALAITYAQRNVK